MTFFLLVFILLYGSLHFHFYIKIRKASPLSPRTRNVIILLLIALLLTPIVERSMIRLGIETPAWFLAFIGYIWMGVIFLFFNMAVLFDIYAIIIHICLLSTHEYLSF